MYFPIIIYDLTITLTDHTSLHAPNVIFKLALATISKAQ